ncbi:class E sortase [Stomatohabitans albus]|uniref:class E sortase n=1 Tax=Stomatohabitans albus TaxID=3110766 RepID=UPI00300C5C71
MTWFEDPIEPNAEDESRLGYLYRSVSGRYHVGQAGIRFIRAMAWVVLILSVAGLVWPSITDQVSAHLVQQPLADQLVTSPDLFARFEQRRLIAGDPMSRIVIPKIGVDNVVVEGTDADDLRAGAGHYVGSPLPGEAGNVAIAGHRSTWASPFRHLDQLVVGDQIELHSPVATHVYTVVEGGEKAVQTRLNDDCAPGAPCWVTADNAWTVVDPEREAMLTLTTCHPVGSARQRLVLRAKLVSSRTTDGKALPLPTPIEGPLPPGPAPSGAVPGGV